MRKDVFTARNYWRRLKELLSLEDRPYRLDLNHIYKYQHLLWRDRLQKWAEDYHKGSLGILRLPPHNRAGNHYIALPLSQALLRIADISRVGRHLFEQHGLPTGDENLGPADIDPVLNDCLRKIASVELLRQFDQRRPGGRDLAPLAAWLDKENWPAVAPFSRHALRVFADPPRGQRSSEQLAEFLYRGRFEPSTTRSGAKQAKPLARPIRLWLNVTGKRLRGGLLQRISPHRWQRLDADSLPRVLGPDGPRSISLPDGQVYRPLRHDLVLAVRGASYICEVRVARPGDEVWLLARVARLNELWRQAEALTEDGKIRTYPGILDLTEPTIWRACRPGPVVLEASRRPGRRREVPAWQDFIRFEPNLIIEEDSRLVELVEVSGWPAAVPDCASLASATPTPAWWSMASPAHWMRKGWCNFVAEALPSMSRACISRGSPAGGLEPCVSSFANPPSACSPHPNRLPGCGSR